MGGEKVGKLSVGSPKWPLDGAMEPGGRPVCAALRQSTNITGEKKSPLQYYDDAF